MQIPFFCGHHSACWEPGNSWALQQAKSNLAKSYFLVGVTESMEDFVALLEASLPRFFKGALELFNSGMFAKILDLATFYIFFLDVPQRKWNFLVKMWFTRIICFCVLFCRGQVPSPENVREAASIERDSEEHTQIQSMANGTRFLHVCQEKLQLNQKASVTLKWHCIRPAAISL